jgi:dCTP deaminase
MRLLRDEELITNLTGPEADQYITGVILPVDEYGKDSPVQASSIDLHIGTIYLPGTKESATGAATTKPDHVLKTGETAVVTTRETLHLPLNVAAFGFPPSSVSFKGLLMTNPGHVDPGYTGYMRFTVINMGKDPYPLNSGDPIVTLLIFLLDADVHRGWVARKGASQLPSQRAVNRLSRDFVDVERRATGIARSQGIQWSLGITTGLTLLILLLNSGFFVTPQRYGRPQEETRSLGEARGYRPEAAKVRRAYQGTRTIDRNQVASQHR